MFARLNIRDIGAPVGTTMEPTQPPVQSIYYDAQNKWMYTFSSSYGFVPCKKVAFFPVKKDH
jgi:hypothetical protein